MLKVFKSWGSNICKCHRSKPGGQEDCFGNKDSALNNAPISFGWVKRLCAWIWLSKSLPFKFFAKFCARSVIPNRSSRTPWVVSLLKAHPELAARISKSTCAVMSISPGEIKISQYLWFFTDFRGPDLRRLCLATPSILLAKTVNQAELGRLRQ